MQTPPDSMLSQLPQVDASTALTVGQMGAGLLGHLNHPVGALLETMKTGVENQNYRDDSARTFHTSARVLEINSPAFKREVLKDFDKYRENLTTFGGGAVGGMVGGGLGAMALTAASVTGPIGWIAGLAATGVGSIGGAVATQWIFPAASRMFLNFAKQLQVMAQNAQMTDAVAGVALLMNHHDPKEIDKIIKSMPAINGRKMKNIGDLMKALDTEEGRMILSRTFSDPGVDASLRASTNALTPYAGMSLAQEMAMVANAGHIQGYELLNQEKVGEMGMYLNIANMQQEQMASMQQQAALSQNPNRGLPTKDSPAAGITV